MIRKQRRKVGVAGSFQNQMMGNNASEPKVGEGATILHYSDREPYEVIEVSEDGKKCVIRTMNAKFIGSGYGDERYEYSSNPEGYTSTLEWNEKKGCWGKVHSEVAIIKSLAKKYSKEYGYGWYEILLKENNLSHKDLIDGEPMGVYTKYKLIKGLTKEYKRFYEVSIIFGFADKYVDPHF